MKLFYVHGGPGLNAKAEKERFEDQFARSGVECTFWNEPSHNRGLDQDVPLSFELLQHDLKRSLTSSGEVQRHWVVAHSFGCALLNSIYPDVERYLAGAVFIAPMLDFKQFCAQVYQKGAELLADSNPDFAQRLTNLLSDQGTDLVVLTSDLKRIFQQTSLLELYWESPNAADFYFSQLINEWSPNVDAFEQVIASMNQWVFANPMRLPLLSYLGGSDPIIELECAKAIVQEMGPSEIYSKKNWRHYPHFEDESLFGHMLSRIRAISSDESQLSAQGPLA